MTRNAEDYLKQGNEFFKKGDFDKAIVHYTEAIRFNRDYASAYFNRSKAYEKKGDDEKAREDYEQAIYLNPDYDEENSSEKKSKNTTNAESGKNTKVKIDHKSHGGRSMSRSRVDIQKDVNLYRGDLESRNIDLNGPTWADSRHDPRYYEMIKNRDEAALQLLEFEKELEKAKARGEKGRNRSEIKEEISDMQSKVDSYRSMLNRMDPDSMPYYSIEKTAQQLQCQINALQRELSEAVK